MAFSVSSAKVSITPTIAQNPYMAGYGAQGAARTVTSSTPYSQPLYVRCVVLWEDGYPHAIIGVDVLAIPRAMNQSIRQRLLPLAGWSNSDITLNANHTHNGPVLIDMLQPYTAYGLSDLTLVRSYSDWLEDRIVSAVQSALNAARTSVSMEYATTTASIAFNRVGLSEVERTVSIIIARAGNGSPRAIVWSYGCHPISADWQERWDGDWPAGACGLLESYYGSSCMPVFLQGAAGDQNPVYPWGWSQRDSHASVLYSAVRNAVNAGGRSLSGPLLTSYTDVSLPLQTLSLSTARSQYIGRFGNP